MWYQAIHYLKFLLRSTNQHGIHSPFVYDLITKCFYDKSKKTGYKNITNYKKRLKKTDHTISITDFGVGSRKFKSNNRKVSDLAKHVSIKIKNAKLLYRITNYIKPNTILELGTSLGLATQTMSLGNPNTKITTIEGCPNTSAFTKEELRKQSIQNIDILVGDFSKIIPTLEQSNFDLIFFDGNHSKQATLDYFKMLLPKAHNDSVFIFDDIYWSKGMTEAWKTIKQHEQVTVSIDTFFWGIIFFRKEQATEHFTIRI